MIVGVVPNAAEDIDRDTKHPGRLHEHPGRRRHGPDRSSDGPTERIGHILLVTNPKTGEQRIFNISRSLHAFVGLPEECTQLGQMILAQLAELMKPGSADASLVHSVQGMVALEPKDAMQSLLACQMLGVHTAAFTFLRRAAVNDQTIEGVDRNINRAVRLMKLFNNQAELMLKLKGKSGQQKVTVEHVNVAPGGQAIVGLVTAPGGGSKNES